MLGSSPKLESNFEETDSRGKVPRRPFDTGFILKSACRGIESPPYQAGVLRNLVIVGDVTKRRLALPSAWRYHVRSLGHSQRYLLHAAVCYIGPSLRSPFKG